MGKDRTLGLIAVGGGVIALAFLLRKYVGRAEESPSGSMSITAMATGKTVTVTLKAKASGTYPISFSGTMRATDITDRDRPATVASWPVSGTIQSGEEYTIIKTFTGTPGHIYAIEATVTFKNNYGTDTKRASTGVTIAGVPPTGVLSISAKVS